MSPYRTPPDDARKRQEAGDDGAPIRVCFAVIVAVCALRLSIAVARGERWHLALTFAAALALVGAMALLRLRPGTRARLASRRRPR